MLTNEASCNVAIPAPRLMVDDVSFCCFWMMLHTFPVICLLISEASTIWDCQSWALKNPKLQGDGFCVSKLEVFLSTWPVSWVQFPWTGSLAPIQEKRHNHGWIQCVFLQQKKSRWPGCSLSSTWFCCHDIWINTVGGRYPANHL